MKRLAEKIKSAENRLLPTPLYRYSSKAHGVIDGAVFALVTANDPEVLIVIEAYANDSTMKYRYKLGRMNSQPRKVFFGDEEIWDLQGFWRNPKSPNDPYIERRDSTLPANLKQEAIKEAAEE